MTRFLAWFRSLFNHTPKSGYCETRKIWCPDLRENQCDECKWSGFPW